METKIEVVYIAGLVARYGSIAKTADAIGITERTLFSYMKNSDKIPSPMKKLLRYMHEDDGIVFDEGNKPKKMKSSTLKD